MDTEQILIPKKIESLARLKQLLQSDVKIEPWLWVGGRVVAVDSGRPQLSLSLFGQGCRLDITLMDSRPAVELCDLVLARINTSEIFRLNDSQFKAVAEEIQIVSSTTTKPGKMAFGMDFDLNQKWNQFKSALRGSLNVMGLQEVETPFMVKCPGMEPHLDSFSVELKQNQHRQPLGLRTSPELHLKKLLCKDWTDIFEMRTSFRNEIAGPHHEPEFTMLEWYRAFAGLEDILSDLKKLVHHLADLSLTKMQPWQIFTMADLFKTHLQFELTPATKKQELLNLCIRQGLSTDATDTFDDVFFRLFLTFIEPNLPIENPVIIKNYPPSQAALAKINGEGWANRFEFYWQGLEIANAYDELTDPIEQQKRFENDLQMRKSFGKEVAIDTEFLMALNHAMPAAGGIALGVDRLFMALYAVEDIQLLRQFSFRNFFDRY